MHEPFLFGLFLFGIALVSGLVTLYLVKKLKGQKDGEPSESMLAFLALRERGDKVESDACEQEKRIQRLRDQYEVRRRSGR